MRSELEQRNVEQRDCTWESRSTSTETPNTKDDERPQITLKENVAHVIVDEVPLPRTSDRKLEESDLRNSCFMSRGTSQLR